MARIMIAAVIAALAWGGTARADGPINWSAPAKVTSSGPMSLSCPSASLCVGVGGGSTIVHSDHPAAAQPWAVQTVSVAGGAPLLLQAVSCPTVSMCAAESIDGRIAVTTDPQAATPAWTVTQADTTTAAGSGDPRLQGIACPSAALCVATDGSGNVVTSTDPTASAPTWTVAHVDTGIDYECFHYGESGPDCQSSLGPVSCASVAHCAAADSGGRLFVSDDPTGGAVAWHTNSPGPTVAFPNGLACPSAALCLGSVDYDQHVWINGLAGPEPGGDDAGVWGVWCGSPALCVAMSDGGGTTGELYASSRPGDRTATWRLGAVAPPSSAAGGDQFTSGACASARLCFAADRLGQILVGRPAATAAEIRAAIVRALTPHGTSGRLTAVRSRRGYTTSVSAPDAGRLVVRWYAGTGRHRRLIAIGRAPFAQPGHERLTVTLNRAGRTALSHTATAQVTAVAGFTPTKQRAVTVRRVITLR